MLHKFGTLLTATLLASALFAQSKPKAIQAPAPVTPTEPQIMILNECEAEQCLQHVHGVWIFEGDHGQAFWPYGAVADLTITSRVGNQITIKRIDHKDSSSMNVADPTTGTFHGTYTGTLDASKTSFEGTVDFSGDFNGAQGARGPFRADGADAVCANALQCQLSHEQVTALGMNALMADMPNAARKCFEAAKLQGDVEAQAMLGVLTFQGRGEKADPAAGLAEITAAANAGSYLGQFSLNKIYEVGAGGVPKNPQLAAYWGDAAHKTEQARTLAPRQSGNAQMAQVNRQDMAGFAFALVLSSVFGGGGSPMGGISDIDRTQQMNRQDISDCHTYGDPTSCGRAGMSTPQ